MSQEKSRLLGLSRHGQRPSITTNKSEAHAHMPYIQAICGLKFEYVDTYRGPVNLGVYRHSTRKHSSIKDRSSFDVQSKKHFKHHAEYPIMNLHITLSQLY